MTNPAYANRLLPLESQSWKQLNFNKIPPNKVTFQNQSILIEVQESSSPLIYPMQKTEIIQGFKVQGHVIGKIISPPGLFEEDVYLRFGLIQTGGRKLNAIQRLFSAPWVKQLFEMAPSGKGLEIIHFFNLTSEKEQLARSRVYPGTDLMQEYVHTLVQEDGSFSMVHQLPKEIEIAGLWLSSNGDHNKSSFHIQIDSIELF